MNERALCHIWNRLRFRREGLHDVDGNPLQLVYRGRWQHGPGPDFRGAIIARADGLLLRGDVELHVRTSEWTAHRHQTDRSFDGVILHVVLHHDGRGPTLRSDGRSVPVLALAGYLLDDSLPNPPELPWPDDPCRPRLGAASDEEVGDLLDAMGDRRLLERAARFEGDLAALDPDDVLYRGLMDAMGYSQNRAPFRELAEKLPLAEIAAAARRLPAGERADAIAAAMLETAGLAAAAASAEQTGGWGGQPRAPMGRERWRLAGIRPANNPARRLRGVAALLATALDRGLAVSLCLDWPQSPPRATCVALRRRLLVTAPACEPGPCHLIGPGRAADAVVNVLLPFTLAYADLHSQPALGEAALAAYRRHARLAENETTRLMAALLLAPGRRRALIRSARRQQGLLHLFRVYCDHRRCGECPAASADG